MSDPGSAAGDGEGSRAARRALPAAFRLPIPGLLAARYLKSTRKDAFTTFLSAVAVIAIALGVAALILAQSALNGFQTELRGEVLARTAQVEVDLPEGQDPRQISRDLEERSDVVSAQPILRGRGWISSQGRAVPVEMVGFASDLPPSFPDAEALEGAAPVWGPGPGREPDRGGEPPGPGLWLSQRRAQAWDLEAGDPVEVVSPRPTLTPFGPQPRVRSVPLAGIYRGGRTEDRERIALPLTVAESLLGEARTITVDAGGLEPALALASALPGALPEGSRVRSWQELNRPLFFALRLERVMLFVAVSLVVLVAALALVADLSLIVSAKRSDLGMLLAMGATPGELRQALVLLGALLAGIGTFAGTAVGLGGAWLLDRLELLELPGDVFLIDHVPFRATAVDLLWILGVTAALALGASFYAARRATFGSPVGRLGR